MKKNLIIPVLLICLSPWAAQAIPEPVLNLQADTSSITDISSAARSLKLHGTESGWNNVGLIIPSAGVRIIFDKNDPLFSLGDCTWLLQCIIKDPTAWESPYSLGGRWEPNTNERVIALAANGPDGRLRGNLSTNGEAKAGTIVAASPEPPLPAEEWISIVFTYKAGKSLSTRIFSRDGSLLGERTYREDIPDKLYDAPADFTLGSPKEVGLEVKSLRVWDEALTEHDIMRLLGR